MSTVRYIGDEPREVSILPEGFLRLVEPDQTFEVPDRYIESYWCQPHLYETPGYDGPDDETESEPPPVEMPPAAETVVPAENAGRPRSATVTEKTTIEKAGK